MGCDAADINNDGWLDLYIARETTPDTAPELTPRDYLYINQQNGTFRDDLEKCMQHTSLASMGADIADINNDGYPEIYVTDMFPETEARVKTKTQFEDWDKYQSNIQGGYYRQYVRNVLQLNSGPVNAGGDISFSEISRLAGVNATDWSWAPLMADFDNDGWKDVLIADRDVEEEAEAEEVTSDALVERISEHIEWNSREIADALRRQARLEDTSRWDVIDFP